MCVTTTKQNPRNLFDDKRPQLSIRKNQGNLPDAIVFSYQYDENPYDVRIHNNACEHTVRVFVWETHECITRGILKDRQQVAEDHGDTYEFDGVIISDTRYNDLVADAERRFSALNLIVHLPYCM